MILRLNPGDEIDHGLADGGKNTFTRGAHLVSDVQFDGFAFDRHGDQHGIFWLSDETPFFLPVTDHVNRELSVRMVLANEFGQLLIDRIAGIR